MMREIEERERVTGTVTKWLEERGYGFARSPSGGQDVFIHVRELCHGLVGLAPGDVVMMRLEETERGWRGRDVEKV